VYVFDHRALWLIMTDIYYHSSVFAPKFQIVRTVVLYVLLSFPALPSLPPFSLLASFISALHGACSNQASPSTVVAPFNFSQYK
jgi:hypothetical protein